MVAESKVTRVAICIGRCTGLCRLWLLDTSDIGKMQESDVRQISPAEGPKQGESSKHGRSGKQPEIKDMNEMSFLKELIGDGPSAAPQPAPAGPAGDWWTTYSTHTQSHQPEAVSPILTPTSLTHVVSDFFES